MLHKGYTKFIMPPGIMSSARINIIRGFIRIIRNPFILNSDDPVFDMTGWQIERISPVQTSTTINIRAKKSTVFIRGNRYTILPALTLDVFIAAEVIEGSCTKDLFQAFIIN